MVKTGSWSGAVCTLALCAVFLIGTAGHAQPEAAAPPPPPADITQQCVDAHLATQQLRKAAKLSAAKEQLFMCVQQDCPPPIKDDCGRWLTALEPQIPSIVVTAKDKDGRDTTEVQVMLDGVKIADRLDGVALTLDPGAHEVKCVHRGETHVEKVVIVQAQKSRAISCSFAVVPDTSPPVREGPRADAAQPVAGYIIGVLSLGAFASFAAFGIIGKRDADDLDDECGKNAPAPLTQTCTNDQIDPVKKKLLAADISLGVGVGLLAVSMGLLLHHFLSEPDDDTTPTARVDFGATPDGAAGQLTVSF